MLSWEIFSNVQEVFYSNIVFGKLLMAVVWFLYDMDNWF